MGERVGSFTTPTVFDIPPYDQDCTPAQRKLGRHLRARPRGVNVWMLTTQTDGVYDVSERQPQPTLEAGFNARGNTELGADSYVRLFHGGRKHYVDATEKAALEAAGYTVDALSFDEVLEDAWDPDNHWLRVDVIVPDPERAPSHTRSDLDSEDVWDIVHDGDSLRGEQV